METLDKNMFPWPPDQAPAIQFLSQVPLHGCHCANGFVFTGTTCGTREVAPVKWCREVVPMIGIFAPEIGIFFRKRGWLCTESKLFAQIGFSYS